MRTLVVLFVLCGLSSALVAKSPIHDVFVTWKAKYNKLYRSEAEEIRRLRNFEENAFEVLRHNLEASMGKHSFTLELNHMADMSEDEYQATMLAPRDHRMLLNRPNRRIFNAERVPVTSVPDEMDWRKQGYVTEVKDQGLCGSCWSFAATGALEGAWFNHSGSLPDLSEQQQVSCNTRAYGCDGGLVELAFDFWIEQRGAVSEDSYPYKSGDDGVDRTCQQDQGDVVATLTDYEFGESGDEETLKRMSAAVGPIAIAIDAGTRKFQLYSSGVFYNWWCGNTDKALDHAVLLVGYGTDAETGADFWLVKNSWSDQWGEEGYVKMARNRRNNCGVATDTVYPIV